MAHSLRGIVRTADDHRRRCVGDGETKLGRGEMQVLLRAQGVRKLEHGKGVDGTFRLRVRYRGRHFFCTGMDSMASLFPRRRRAN